MANNSSASELLGSLKDLQNSQNQKSRVVVQSPTPTSETPQSANPERRVVVRKGDAFVVETREKRIVRKNFIFSPSCIAELEAEARSLGISQNELINQILVQRYAK